MALPLPGTDVVTVACTRRVAGVLRASRTRDLDLEDAGSPSVQQHAAQPPRGREHAIKQRLADRNSLVRPSAGTPLTASSSVFFVSPTHEGCEVAGNERRFLLSAPAFELAFAAPCVHQRTVMLGVHEIDWQS